ncbi:MAG TPA: choice-of-anchor X domain-containing protein [Kofleriaceae bacterium]|nr:choice-of-anchor X domain-containing protein [Kofleriaceae bacterium]
MSKRTRASVLAALFVGGLLLLWLVFPRSSSTPDAHEPQARQSAARPLPSPAPGTANGADLAGDPGSELDQEWVPQDQITPFVPSTPEADDLAPDTQLLAEEFIPGTTEWEEVPLIESGTEVIRFMPKRYNVIAPQPVVLYLEVVDSATGRRARLDRPIARIRSFGWGSDVPWIEMPLVDDGSGEDAAAGDGRYTATYTPTPDQRARLQGHVLAEGEVRTAEAGVRKIPQGLIYTNGPRARMTGRWRDHVRDHLFIEGEIEVDAAGLFTLMGQIVGPGRRPIALVRTMDRLEAGTHWMTLRVWGKALRDAGVDGPYELRNVLLTRDMNEQGSYDPGPTLLLAHTTKPYPVGEFSPDAYVEPAADRGEEIGPDHPSQAGKPGPLYDQSERPSARGL